MKWSFDDISLGLKETTASCLKVRLIKRPKGLSNNTWYTFAGKLIKVLNNEPR